MDPTGTLILGLVIAAIWIISLYLDKKESSDKYYKLNQNIDDFMMKKLKCRKPSPMIYDPFEESLAESVCFNGHTTYYLDDSILRKTEDQKDDYKEMATYYAFSSYFLYLALDEASGLADYEKLIKRYKRLDSDFHIKSGSKDESVLQDEVIGSFSPLTHDYSSYYSNKNISKLYKEFTEYLDLDMKNESGSLSEKESKRFDELEDKFDNYLYERNDEKFEKALMRGEIIHPKTNM